MNQAKQTRASWQRRGWYIRFVLEFHGCFLKQIEEAKKARRAR